MKELTPLSAVAAPLSVALVTSASILYEKIVLQGPEAGIFRFL